MELPGAAVGEINLTVDNGALTIRSDKKTQSEKTGGTWCFSERQHGAFRYSFRLPEDADGQAASARMEDGVLHVSVPKKALEQPETARKIEISKG